MAGKIGTVDQVKVTVFGPVVNLASRLESMTKMLRAPMLIDETTARSRAGQGPADVARVRRVAQRATLRDGHGCEVSELLPPAAEYPAINRRAYRGLRNGPRCIPRPRLGRRPSTAAPRPGRRRVKDFLTVFIAQHNRTAPPNWDGVITIAEKY